VAGPDGDTLGRQLVTDYLTVPRPLRPHRGEPGAAGPFLTQAGPAAAAFELRTGLAAWTELALCAEVGPGLFYPEKGEPSAPAEKICQGCEVRRQCLAGALERQEKWGVWGGLSERKRRRLLRRYPDASTAVSSVLGPGPDEDESEPGEIAA
jgi:WhiB family redox-sensing transcriptional regulator